MQIHSLPLGGTFGAVKNCGFPGNAVHKAALRSHYRHDEIKMRPIGPITAD